MMRLGVAAIAVVLLAGPGARQLGQPDVMRFSHGIFDDVPLYLPNGPATGMVLLMADDRGPSADDLTRPLVAAGALVGVIDTAAAYAARADEPCVSLQGDLDNLARNIQGFLRLPVSHVPVLAGAGQSAVVAQTMAQAAPAGTFLGLLTLDRCPGTPLPRPMCDDQGQAQPPTQVLAGAEQASSLPWQAVQTAGACAASAAGVGGAQTVVPDDVLRSTWRSGYAALAALAPPPEHAPAQVADLPLIEVPHPPGAPAAHTLALLISGDGGWADIDRVLAKNLSEQGMRVLGMDALRYFWGARTPDGLAADLDRALPFYLARWQLDDVVLIGFSQGADVLPFAVNRLSAPTLAKVRRTVLLSPGKRAAFEFQVSNWLSASDDGLPTTGEIERMPAGSAICVYGAEDEDSVCPTLADGTARTRLPGGHHFDEDYAAVTRVILDAVRRPPG